MLYAHGCIKEDCWHTKQRNDFQVQHI